MMSRLRLRLRLRLRCEADKIVSRAATEIEHCQSVRAGNRHQVDESEILIAPMEIG
jgi:hypothetical protein